jgi:POT family proton-dependent oligopeptide transporter
VIVGGLLMTAGEALLMVPHAVPFFTGLALLICGNGFFKTNISSIVGTLYPQHSPKRDGGFTIFYMGINLGAAASPLLCGYIGETYGWHWGFGLAAVGIMLGVAVFVAPTRLTQGLILAGVTAAVGGLIYFRPDNPYSIAVNVFVALSLLVASVVACVALNRGGFPAEAGQPPDPARLRRPAWGRISAEAAVYVGTIASLLVFILLVSGFSPLMSDGRPVSLVPDSVIAQLAAGKSSLAEVGATLLKEISRPAGLVLVLSGLLAFGYIGIETVRLDKIRRERMYVVVILMFFSLLFWAFFEQAGSSLNNFTDRNMDRVLESRHVTADEVGKTIRIQPTQEQLGYHNGQQLFTLDTLDRLRAEHKLDTDFLIDWNVTPDDVGMGVAARSQEIATSMFQSVNAVYILVFGLVFTALWSWLANLGLEPSTPVKFALGLLQLGLGFAAFWYGAVAHDPRGMVGLGWLLLGYLLHTTGELCLSPVGLSMVTKLSPKLLVSTVMGTWFLATAFSQSLASIIAQFTSVSHGEGGGAVSIPIPLATVHVYGGVFGKIAITALISAAICFALAPFLTRWMHTEVQQHD